MADNADPTQYDPRAQAMEEIHFDWRCIVCCIVALSPFTLNNSISLAPHGLNVINAIPPFIYSVQPGNLFKLSDPNAFFVHSFVVGSFRYPTPSPCCLIYISILFPQFFKTQFRGFGWIHPPGSTYWIVHGRCHDPMYSQNKGGQGRGSPDRKTTQVLTESTIKEIWTESFHSQQVDDRQTSRHGPSGWRS